MKKLNFKLFILFIFLLILSCNTKRDRIWLELKLNKIERYTLNDSYNCYCNSNKYIIEKNIILYDVFPDLPCKIEYFFEKRTDCKKLTLLFDNKELKLDSLYISACSNKEIVYIPGFVKGKYSVTNDSTEIYLEYINEAINSSESTTHLYYILYDKIKKKIKKIEISFPRSAKSE